MKNNKILTLLIFPLVLFSVSGCFLSDLDKVQESEINPKITVPLINSTFGMIDFLESVDSTDLVTTDDEGVVLLKFEESLNTDGIKDLVDFPDQAFAEVLNLNTTQAASLPLQGQITVNELYDFTAEPEEGDELDSLITRSGQLRINLDANFPASGQVKLIFPGITDASGSIVESEIYAWTYPNTLFVQDIIDFEGLKIDFTNGGTTFNDFKFEVELTLFYEGFPIDPVNQLNMSVEFIDLEIGGLYGKIATRTVTTDPDTVAIDFFKELSSGNFYLSEPSISITFNNGYGIPAAVDLGSLTAVKNDQQIPLSGPVGETPTIIDAPSVSEIGEIKSTTILIDKTTSNFPDMLAILPDKLGYQFSAQLNPQGVVEQNFVVEESDIGIDLDIEIPLIGSFSNLVLNDTADFNGEDILGDLQSILFQVRSDNGFPFNLDLQILFRDANGNVIETLFEDNTALLESAIVDSNGDVTESSEKVIQVTLDQEKADLLEAAQTMVIRATFNSFNNGGTVVKIKEDQSLNIKIGIQAVLSLTI